MILINRYLSKTIFLSVLVVLLVLCMLSMLGKIVDDLGAVSGNYTFAELLIYVSLRLPQNINEFMPFAALVGSLIGLGSLASSSELTAIRAAGVSLLQITWAVLKPIIVLIILSLLLAEYIVPVSYDYAENRRAEKRNKTRSALLSTSGLWNKEKNEFMHFNRVQTDGRLQGVTRYQFDEQSQLIATSFARTAAFTNDYWLEEDVIETTFNGDTTQQQQYPTRQWFNQLSPELLSILTQETDKLAITKLHRYIDYLKQQNIDAARYQLSFWEKVLQPLAIISLVLIAVSFVFGSLREVTMGYRIFIGVLVGIAFQMSQRLLGPTSLVYEFPPVLAVAVPILICLFLGVFLLVKKR